MIPGFPSHGQNLKSPGTPRAAGASFLIRDLEQPTNASHLRRVGGAQLRYVKYKVAKADLLEHGDTQAIHVGTAKGGIFTRVSLEIMLGERIDHSSLRTR